MRIENVRQIGETTFGETRATANSDKFEAASPAEFIKATLLGLGAVTLASVAVYLLTSLFVALIAGLAG